MCLPFICPQLQYLCTSPFLLLASCRLGQRIFWFSYDCLPDSPSRVAGMGDFWFYVFVPLGTCPFTVTYVYILIVTYVLVFLLRITLRELSMLAHSVCRNYACVISNISFSSFCGPSRQQTPANSSDPLPL